MNRLRIGDIYRLRVRTGERAFVVKVRCVEKFDQYAVFEHPSGYRECWSYWELERCVIWGAGGA